MAAAKKFDAHAGPEKLVPPDDYYRRTRPDILAIVPPGVKRVLDVGCGEGAMAAKVKAMPGVQEVIGIELNPNAALRARDQLDRVIVGDLEVLELDFPDGYFDCIICADVLEHLRDPWAALRKLRRILSDDGVLIACLPNLRNAIPMLKILINRWEYEEEGIVDQTHLRFFTLHTMKKMFRESGFNVDVAARNYYRDWKFRTARVITLGAMMPFSVFSYSLYAKKSVSMPE
jgi:O-antigen biosynthesis protein